MAVPENFRKLGTIGTAYKGDYDPKEQYKYLNEVYYEGSTYRALKDNPSGPPTADGVNWNYSAKGGGVGAVESVNGKTGAVELTAEDVKAVAVEGDTAENTVAFISNDTIDDDAASWTVVPKIETGIKHSTLAQRISQMFKNVRYLYKMLGSTDIADIGNGTVTGALNALNSNLDTYQKCEEIAAVTGPSREYISINVPNLNQYKAFCLVNVGSDVSTEVVSTAFYPKSIISGTKYKNFRLYNTILGEERTGYVIFDFESDIVRLYAKTNTMYKLFAFK